MALVIFLSKIIDSNQVFLVFDKNTKNDLGINFIILKKEKPE